MATTIFGDPVSGAEEKPAATTVFGDPIPESAPAATTVFGDPIATSRAPVAQDDSGLTQESEGFLQELGEGVISGGIGIAQGIGELGAASIDLAADTNFTSQVTELAQSIREAGGIDPVGFAGKGAEIVTQFVVPGLGAAGLVSKASKLGKLAASGKKLSAAERFSLSGQQVAAAVGADFMVANDGVTSIGDFFGGGPTQTDQSVGLTGRENAARVLLNKVKIGAETGALTIAAPVALGVAGSAAMKTADVVGDVTAPVLAPIARAVRESAPVRKVGEGFREIERKRVFGEAQNEFLNKVADTVSIFRYRGMLPEEIAEQRSLVAGVGEAEVKKAQTALAELDKGIDTVLKGNSDFTRQTVLDSLEAFMTTGRDDLLDAVPLELRDTAKKMRTHIDDLSKDILNSDYINTLRQSNVVDIKNAGEELAETIEKNLNSYFRRRYRAKLDPDYKPDGKTLQVARAGFENDKRSTLQELQRLAEDGRSIESLGLEQTDEGLRLVGNKVDDVQAEIAAENFLQRHRVDPLVTGDKAGRVGIEKLRVGMLKDRAKMPEYQRRLLGEITDVEENFLGTIADLAEFKAVDKYFGRIRNLAENNEGIGRLFAEPGQPVRPGYTVLGADDTNILSPWGSIKGFAVPDRVYKDLTRVVDQDLGTFTAAMKATYAGFLRAKGAVQYGKTVLSPITQIRNVTSAGLFATAQGNVGKGANLWESVRLVLDDINKLTPEDQLAELVELQQRGVVGTQAELQEIRRLLNEGAATGPQVVINGINVGTKFGRMVKEAKGGAFLSSALKKAEDLYQGGDDIWKIYNYKFEQSKLAKALGNMEDKFALPYVQNRGFNSIDEFVKSEAGSTLAKKRGFSSASELVKSEAALAYVQKRGFDSVDEFVKSEAASIVRNNVPNYNLAPEFIKGLRKLPVGNFIAFPFEIIRTGANTITRGLDELASESAEIQKIGMRRLTGAATTFAVFPSALAEFAHQVTGVSEDEMKAFQRSIAAPWERNARLIPTGRDENGLPMYINYSYTNPYDMLERIANGAINQYQQNAELGRDTSRGVALAAFEGLKELTSPFLSEAIITAKLRDVMPTEAFGRDGETVTGARVYNPDAPLGDKLARSFAHVMDALVPSAVPVDVRTGEFEPSRFARAFMDATGVNELVGVSEKDRQQRERQIAGEIARALTGVTENTIDPELGLRFAGYEFMRSRTNASNLFNTIAGRANLVSQGEVLDAYKQANEARFQMYNRFNQVIEDMRKIGLSDREIRKTLKSAKVGDVSELMRGQYVPLPVSDDIRKRMRDNDTLEFLPRKEIRQIQFEQRSREFGPVEEEPTVDLKSPTEKRPSVPEAVAETAEISPVPAPDAGQTIFGDTAEPAPTPTPAPSQTSAPSQRRNEVSPILVTNPVTRATFEGR